LLGGRSRPPTRVFGGELAAAGVFGGRSRSPFFVFGGRSRSPFFVFGVELRE
jgi:hypothetical protein